MIRKKNSCCNPNSLSFQNSIQNKRKNGEYLFKIYSNERKTPPTAFPFKIPIITIYLIGTSSKSKKVREKQLDISETGLLFWFRVLLLATMLVRGKRWNINMEMVRKLESMIYLFSLFLKRHFFTRRCMRRRRTQAQKTRFASQI